MFKENIVFEVLSLEMLEGHEYDKRWTIRDKIFQYRGIVSLYKLDKDKRVKELQREFEEGQKKINQLKADVHLLRLTSSSQEKGDQTRLQNILHRNRRLLLANKNKHPLDLVDILQQMNCIKIKEINRLQHLKKLRMDHLEKSMVEIEEIKKRNELGYTTESDFQIRQLLIGRIEKIKVCHNGAKCINHTFKRMATLMKEDSLYLDHMIAVMSQDATQQSQCISSVRFKSEQAETENVKILSKFYALEEETIALMRLRDRSIRHLRQQVHVQAMKIKNLGREEFGNQMLRFDLSDEPVSQDELSTPLLLQQFEETIEYLKNITEVSDLTQIIPRLQDQIQQKDLLRRQLSLCEKQWENFYLKREHAKESLAFCKTHHPDKIDRQAGEENFIRKKLKEDICKKEECCKKIEQIGKKIIIIRSAIITLSELLNRIRIPDGLPSIEAIEVEPTFEEIINRTKKPIEILELIKEKIKIMRAEIGSAIEEWPCKRLITDETAEVIDMEKQLTEVKKLKEKDPNIVDEAKQEFHDKVSDYCSKAHFGEGNDYNYRLQEDLYLETGVLTRMDVKTTSQRIVNNNETPIVHVSSKKGLAILSSPKKSPRRIRWLKCH